MKNNYKITKITSLHEINIKTKRLAKKQITWFKKEPKLNMIETDNQDLVYNSMMEIING